MKEKYRNQLEDLSGALNRLKETIRQVELTAVGDLYGAKVGSIVIDGGVEYRITEVDRVYQDLNKPFVRGAKRKKNGEWGKKSQYLYRWEPINHLNH